MARSAHWFVVLALACVACKRTQAPEEAPGNAGADAGASVSGSGGASTPAGSSAAGAAATSGNTAPVQDAGTGGAIDCDPRKIVCKRAAPTCGQFEVPSVDGACFGPCVGIEKCPCTGPDQCPDSNQYTCHMSAKHCTPYLR